MGSYRLLQVVGATQVSERCLFSPCESRVVGQVQRLRVYVFSSTDPRSAPE